MHSPIEDSLRDKSISTELNSDVIVVRIKKTHLAMASVAVLFFLVGFISHAWLSGMWPTPSQSLDQARKFDLTSASQVAQNSPVRSERGSVSPDGDPSIGSPQATVIIIEFSDFQCPFCKRFFDGILPQLKAQYIDNAKVSLVYRDFPLSSIHAQAQKAAEAAECANEQGQFWLYHDKLFLEQSIWADNPEATEIFKSYAADLKLELSRFTLCLESGKYAQEVQKDYNEGVLAGVSATPTFFINGRRVIGAQPFETFMRIIEEELEKKQGSSYQLALDESQELIQCGDFCLSQTAQAQLLSLIPTITSTGSANLTSTEANSSQAPKQRPVLSSAQRPYIIDGGLSKVTVLSGASGVATRAPRGVVQVDFPCSDTSHPDAITGFYWTFIVSSPSRPDGDLVKVRQTKPKVELRHFDRASRSFDAIVPISITSTLFGPDRPSSRGGPPQFNAVVEMSGQLVKDSLQVTVAFRIPNDAPELAGSAIKGNMIGNAAPQSQDVNIACGEGAQTMDASARCIVAHIVADDESGTNAVISTEDVARDVEIANQIWSQCCITPILVGIDYIDRHDSPDGDFRDIPYGGSYCYSSEEELALYDINNTPPVCDDEGMCYSVCTDVYYVRDFGAVCGSTCGDIEGQRSGGSVYGADDNIIINVTALGCVAPAASSGYLSHYTLAHELGHALGLVHWEGPFPNLMATNSGTAGSGDQLAPSQYTDVHSAELASYYLLQGCLAPPPCEPW